MMVENSREWDISVCGLNCAKCKIFQAGHGNTQARDELVQSFIKAGSKPEEIKPEGITCGGCRGPPDIHWSPDCEFLPCAQKRGHRYCFECADFPCEKLRKFSSDGYAHHKRTVENMRRMKEIGLETWIAQQKCAFCP